MLKTSRRTTVDPNFTPFAVKSPRWKNVFFDTDGKSYIDSLVFTSIAEAVQDINNVLKPIAGTVYSIASSDGSWAFPRTKYAWALQIPCKE